MRVLQCARVRAAEQGTSVNAVLREQLIRFADPLAGDRAADGFLTLARERAGRSTGGRRSWSREELHLERLRDLNAGQRFGEVVVENPFA